MKNKKNLFEELVTNLTINFMNADEGLLSEETAYPLPGRLAVLAEGFAGGMNLEQVNVRLQEKGYETLYARSLYEAGLIYAFSHGMTYEEWKELYRSYMEKYTGIVDPGKQVFQGGKITLKQLEAYVRENSSDQLETEQLTRFMEKEIIESRGQEDFFRFMDRNVENFSAVREKARYYFCKYLDLYIRSKCEQYYACCEKSERMVRQYGNSLDREERGYLESYALEELNFLKPLTALKKDAKKSRGRMSLEEKKELLENTALTPGGIFDEFNYFYFGYVSVDWMELVFELYGPVECWPDSLQVRIAHALGYCSANPDPAEEKEALAKLRQREKEELRREEEQDREYDRDAKKAAKLYQRGRSGEDYFREFITGKRDINRETLVSFLLFVKMKISLKDDNKITLMRLNRILSNCGFAQLRPDHGFDRFVMDFLRRQAPFSVMEEYVDRQVGQGENFYLYKVYRDAYCHQEELAEYLNVK